MDRLQRKKLSRMEKKLAQADLQIIIRSKSSRKAKFEGGLRDLNCVLNARLQRTSNILSQKAQMCVSRSIGVSLYDQAIRETNKSQKKWRDMLGTMMHRC